MLFGSLQYRSARRRMLLSFLACALALPQGHAAPEPGALTITLTDTNLPPYATPARDGFFDIVATEAFRRVGLGLAVVHVPAERALLLADSGVAGGVLARVAGIDKQYHNLLRVPEALDKMNLSAFSKDRSIPGRFDALHGRAVGFIRGWWVYESALGGREGVIRAEDPEQLFRMLQHDRIEVALYEQYTGLALIQNQGIQGVSLLEPPLFQHDVFIYLHKRYAEQATELAAALRTMKRDGFYQRAYREKLLPYVAGRVP